MAAGVFAPSAGEAEASTRQQAYVDRLVGQCARVGPALTEWAEAVEGKRFAAKFDVDQIRAGKAEDPMIVQGDLIVANASAMKAVWQDVLRILPVTAAFVPLL